MQKMRIAIVGAGFGGMRALYELVSQHESSFPLEIHVFDESERVGGVVNATRQNDFVFEHAAQGFTAHRGDLLDLVKQLHLSKQLIEESPSAKKRYWITPSKLIPMTMNPITLTKEKLLTWREWWRGITEFYVKPAGKRNLSETLFSFFVRRFGEGFARIFIVPLSTVIWAGGSNRLLLEETFPQMGEMERQSGSVMRGFFNILYRRVFLGEKRPSKKVLSFPQGLSFLAAKMLEQAREKAAEKGISLFLHSKITVKNINVTKESLFCDGESFDSLILAIPPWKTSLEFMSESPLTEAWKSLQNVPTHSLTVVGVGFKNHLPPYPGLGAMALQNSPDILGILFVHQIFPQHAPDQSSLYRIMFGGDRDPNFHLKNDDEIKKITLQYLKKFNLTPEHSPDFFEIKRWSQSIPLPTEHQFIVKKSIWQLENFAKGLFLCGNYVQGVGVPDTHLSGSNAARKCLDHLADTHRRLDHKSRHR